MKNIHNSKYIINESLFPADWLVDILNNIGVMGLYSGKEFLFFLFTDKIVSIYLCINISDRLFAVEVLHKPFLLFGFEFRNIFFVDLYFFPIG